MHARSRRREFFYQEYYFEYSITYSESLLEILGFGSVVLLYIYFFVHLFVIIIIPLYPFLHHPIRACMVVCRVTHHGIPYTLTFSGTGSLQPGLQLHLYGREYRCLGREACFHVLDRTAKNHNNNDNNKLSSLPRKCHVWGYRSILVLTGGKNNHHTLIRVGEGGVGKLRPYRSISPGDTTRVMMIDQR